MDEQGLREIISKHIKINPEQLSAETPLTGPLAGSLGRARLDANLRSRFGINNPDIYNVGSFGELCTVLGIESSSNLAAPVVPSPQISPVLPIMTSAAGSGITLGVDVESVAALPDVSDYWEDDFYKTTFTQQEIAYALLQSSPRASFAAIWCAKEALRKADPLLANTDWQMIEVIHDKLGKPSLLINRQQTSGALSLSHTDEVALAVFVSAPAPQPIASVSSPPHQSISSAYGYRGRIALMIAALALLFSIAAIVLPLLRH
jgi:phosphopantetheine--protein transferase-like protein